MEKTYNINNIIDLRDKEGLKWKEILEITGISLETLRKAYKREKEGLTISEANPNNAVNLKLRGLKRKYELIRERGGCFNLLTPEMQEIVTDFDEYINENI